MKEFLHTISELIVLFVMIFCLCGLFAAISPNPNEWHRPPFYENKLPQQLTEEQKFNRKVDDEIYNRTLLNKNLEQFGFK